MLNLIMHIFCKNKIYTTESKLFYKLYKWDVGLPTLLSLRKIFYADMLFVTGLICFIFVKSKFNFFLYLLFIFLGLLILIFQLREQVKIISYNALGARTPSQIRALQMEDFIRKFVSINGKALGRKEWKAIKKYDIRLYNDLLSNECNHICYYYSLEIAKVIKDSSLLWGAIEDLFEEGHIYYAHAVILRNGYIYDSNMRQSDNYKDFIKLYNFKLYKQWNYDEYSKKDFRESERNDFRNWCIKNNVKDFEMF